MRCLAMLNSLVTSMDPGGTWNILEGVPIGTVSGWTLVAVVAIALIKGWPALRELKMKEDGSLRSDLLGRISKLEDDLSGANRNCAEMLAEMRRDYDERIAELRKDYEARIAAMGRQIDVLQRESYEMRRASMATIERLKGEGE